MPNYEDFKKYDELSKQKKTEPSPPQQEHQSFVTKILKPLRSAKK